MKREHLTAFAIAVIILALIFIFPKVPKVDWNIDCVTYEIENRVFAEVYIQLNSFTLPFDSIRVDVNADYFTIEQECIVASAHSPTAESSMSYIVSNDSSIQINLSSIVLSNTKNLYIAFDMINTKPIQNFSVSFNYFRLVQLNNFYSSVHRLEN